MASRDTPLGRASENRFQGGGSTGLQGKTHIVTGVSIAVAVMHPSDLSALLTGIAAAAVGSVISDIDAGPSGSRNSAVRTGAMLLCILCALLVIDTALDHHILAGLSLHIKSSRLFLTVPAFILLCSLGILSGHRTFTHSFASLLLFSLSFHLLLPAYSRFFIIGFASHLILDWLNYRGIMLFYPLRTRFSLKLCRSDGIVNRILLIAGIIALVLLIYESEPVRQLLGSVRIG